MPFRIMTANVNGIRSAIKKGFFNWLKTQHIDVVCVQELKAQEQDLAEEAFSLQGYHAHYHCAQKKGYSGVGIYSLKEPKNVIKGLGFPLADEEGRYIAIKIDHLWIASLYLPSGTSGEERQTLKYKFLDEYDAYLQTIRTNFSAQDEMIICGDWNIAHQNIDLKNWRSNQKNSGFLPQERAWLTQLFAEKGLVDAFRIINQEPDQYTWWSNRGNAWAKNVGWRIDYQIVTPGLRPTIKSASIYKEQRFSDHAPLIMEYDIIF